MERRWEDHPHPPRIGIGLDRAFSDGITVAGVSVSFNAFFLSSVLSIACFRIAIDTLHGFFVDRENGIF
jgi:hypothetical protein